MTIETLTGKRSAKISTSFEMSLMADVAKHHDPARLPPRRPAFTPGRCVHAEVSKGLGLFKCEKPTDEGWCCPEHQVKIPRRWTGQTTSAEIDGRAIANGTLAHEILSKGGTRIGSHYNLMRATIFNPDGTQKFPERFDPSKGKFLAPLLKERVEPTEEEDFSWWED